jgi:predicted transcriptional regulator
MVSMKGETQRHVQQALAEGLSNKEIACRLHVSISTVKWHVNHLMAARGLYGLADSRRLIVTLVQEKMFALTACAGASTLPASVPEKPNHAHDAAQL